MVEVTCFVFNVIEKVCALGSVCHCHPSATVAQLVEQLICNQPVGGSSPLGGSIFPVKSFSFYYVCLNTGEDDTRD